jgi:membrane glycosyltransferase
MPVISAHLTPRAARGIHAAPTRAARAAQPILSLSCDSTRDAATTPPLHRGSMPAQPWVGFWRGLGRGLTSGLRRLLTPWAAPARPVAPANAASLARQRVSRQRRQVFMLLIALSTAGTTALFAHAQPTAPTPLAAWMQAAQIALYALLSAWVTSGFVTALMGAWVLLRGDQHALSGRAVRHHRMNAEARTAVIMPICHEDVATVFAGLRATCESMAATARSQGFAPAQFDVFVLSDSSRPEVLAAERAAWEELRATLATADLPQVEVYYRARRRRTHRKAGNVADFCRRWGRDYRYMVVLDADSVMSGDSLATLVKLMEANPQAGIIQTATQAVGHVTLHARAQQFASRVTGRLFTLGMQFWQLGESHYWGHNAILRVEPFMRHCGLAPIGGKDAPQGGLSGPILSHDFVEAALMRRAGWEVWLVSDIGGSYEQQPPDLLAELQRDRRWCQGNLQNAQLMAEPGLHPVHRAMFVTGALAYLSAPLWMAFLTLGGVLWFTGAGLGSAWTSAFDMNGDLAWLWAWTLCLLFVPRLLGLLAVLLKREQHFYGGARKLLQSAGLEAVLALLQAPIRMIAHSLFVLIALTGWKLEWKSPPREAAAVSWAHALRQFAPVSLALLLLVGGMAAFQAWNMDSTYPLWSLLLILLPVGLPLLLAAPLTVLSSQPGLGSALRERRWLLIPQEAWPHAVLRRAWRHAGA